MGPLRGLPLDLRLDLLPAPLLNLPPDLPGRPPRRPAGSGAARSRALPPGAVRAGAIDAAADIPLRAVRLLPLDLGAPAGAAETTGAKLALHRPPTSGGPCAGGPVEARLFKSPLFGARSPRAPRSSRASAHSVSLAEALFAGGVSRLLAAASPALLLRFLGSPFPSGLRTVSSESLSSESLAALRRPGLLLGKRWLGAQVGLLGLRRGG